MKFLKSKKSYSSSEDFLRKGTGDELLCMSYLKAMDNYLNVKDAIRYSDYAIIKNPKSFTYNIISSLIKSQNILYSDRCKVYQLTDRVRQDASLKRDMNEEAIKIIFEYMDKYKHNCH